MERRRSVADGRVVTLHLTKAGHGLRAQAAAVPGQLLACLAPQTGDLDLPALKRCLDQLLIALEAPR